MKLQNKPLQGKAVKSLWISGMISILLLPLLAAGCGGTPTPTSPPENSMGIVTIDIPLEQFIEQENVTRSAKLLITGTLIVRLGTDLSFKYKWSDAIITDTSVIAQVSRSYEPPADPDKDGASGTEVWTFEPLKKGNCVMKFYYTQEGDTLPTHTLTLSVTVK